jgi:hypothetical protein
MATPVISVSDLSVNYDGHRWASDPGQVVTGAMMDCVRSSGIFSFVEAYDGREMPNTS